MNIKDSKAFYCSEILSKNLAETPEGFLICKNVPIARTGYQEYLGSELDGINNVDKEQIYRVLREEDEVFDSKAIASFEGKPFTDEHPTIDEVNSENYSQYCKGVVMNVRRGEESETDKLFADIIVYDPITINKIKNGKREISCGYSHNIGFKEDGTICQINIRGNHVALVGDGRAGTEVRIKDSKKKLGVRNMKKTAKNSIIKRLLPLFSKDAEPEEVAEVLTALTDESIENTEETKTDDEDTPSNVTTDSDVLQKVLSTLETIQNDMDILKSNMSEVSNPLNKVEDELEEIISDEEEIVSDEEDNTLAVDDMEEEGLLTDSEDLVNDEDETTSTTDAKAVLNLVRQLKPVVANMKNEKQRKKITDSLSYLARRAKYKKSRQKVNGYAQILDTKRQVMTRQNVLDSKNRKTTSDLGMNIARNRNPHYKK